jgi:outer membrane protein TolC
MLFQFGLRPDTVYAPGASFRPGIIGLVTVVGLLAWPLTDASAQHDVPLTIAEAEDLALASEPGQQALRARAAALEEQAIVAGTLPDPMLRLGLNNYPIESGGFTTEGMTNAGAVYRQAFPRGDTRSLSNLKFTQLAQAQIREADARGDDVLTATRIAWLDLYYWSKARDLVRESRPFFDDLATITRSLYAVGRRNQQDVLRAELELSRLDDRLIDIERQQSRARAQLGQWIGDAAERRVADKLPQWDGAPPLEDLLASLQAHPTLQAADARIAAQDTGVDLAEQRNKPGWALDVGYSHRNGSLPSGDPRSDFITVGVSVDLPFFRKKSVDSTLSAALQDRSAAVADKERVLRSLESRLAAEYSRWQELSRRLALYEERILVQARDHAQAALLAYQNDRGNFADVMRGYIDDLNTRIDYVRLNVEREQAYAVLANLGGIPR